ncbi:transmembrane protein 179 [Trichogramma pretiosum]|uniref:transmembrane protein 179 n=1 Tax=Trichogramma pretiosum TaxID=7493 RepID=UPI0006C95D35|nr:transmembrane protein 179 [Trichogramma pretiosum]XP_023315976.1 transmembrane protein 179 [Trichogramma pretiosum]XP_023315977.1 transmembrane protein 179 [Trichogramma pretiosum]XP_023315978.1 transmembrane protein 179 [Trichogramma pretiosum]XP_023315979.1 transmembrane protein 179 [Trichogramma pretiosum]XP_023315980.1 transmembrane protein 179 [Trichogramma pretiosum]
MAFTNVLLLSQIAGYVVALILSLCVIVPMSLHINEFRGHCLLFSTGNWRESDGQFVADWASRMYCDYTIFVGLVLFLVSAVQIYRSSMLMYKGKDSSFFSAFIDVILSVFLTGVTLIAAVIITLGFMSWCQCMTKRFPSCELSAGNDIDKSDSIDTTGFHIELGVAQFAAWSSLSIWVGLSVFATLKLLRYHQLENMKVSMYRERQKLIEAASNVSSVSNASSPKEIS